jgi:hypothetical protein
MSGDSGSAPSAAEPAAWDRERVPAEEYARISRSLASAESPVGIDAKHTHVLILHALERIERRLSVLERRMEDPLGR